MYLGLMLCLLGWAVVLEKSVGAPRVTKAAWPSRVSGGGRDAAVR
jgi:hypothetical protein